MTRIAHISDLHFGREDPLVVQGLLDALTQTAPDLIVVSGDLTQRAKKRQFRAAKAFLDGLPKVPHLIVPGNHDVSTTNLYERVAHPLRRYRRFIARDLAPLLVNPDVAIAGINTVRVLSRKNGRINRLQVRQACAQLNSAGSTRIKIVVTHHPIDLPPDDREHELVRRAAKAMVDFAGCGVDLFLSGHLHTTQTISTCARYRIAGHSAVVAQAGTAVSTRTRDEANSWNLLTVSHAPEREISIQPMMWSVDRQRFEPRGSERYRKGTGGWVPA